MNALKVLDVNFSSCKNINAINTIKGLYEVT